MSSDSSRSLLRILLCEVQEVLTALRQNARCATTGEYFSVLTQSGIVPERVRKPGMGYFSAVLGDAEKSDRKVDLLPPPTLLNGLYSLRAMLHQCKSDRAVSSFHAMTIVGPFLAVVRSKETNDVVIGAVLASLKKFLCRGVFDLTRLGTQEAMIEIVEAVVSCSFEAACESGVEIVTMQIIEILKLSVTVSSGYLLDDNSVWNIFHHCFKHCYQIGRRPNLGHFSEQTLTEITGVMFKNFQRIMTAAHFGSSALPTTQPSVRKPSWSESPNPLCNSSDDKLSAPLIHSQCSSNETDRGNGCNDNRDPDESHTGRVGDTAGCYGLPCTVKIFGFLCTQLQRASLSPDYNIMSTYASDTCDIPERKDSILLFCLRLIRMALEACGGLAVSRIEPLLSLVRDDLSHTILSIGQHRHKKLGLEVLTEAMAIIRCLWDPSFRRHLKVQFEAFFVGIFLRHLKYLVALAQKHGNVVHSPSEKNSMSAATEFICGCENDSMAPSILELEIVMEALVDFCSEPSLFLDIFSNFDCDLSCEDILESMIHMLASCARSPFPVLAGRLRFLCMEALLNGLKAIQLRTPHDIVPSSATTSEDSESSSCRTKEGGAFHNEENREKSHSSHNKCSREHPLWQRKVRKRQLKAAVSLFNRKAYLGLQALQAAGLLPDPLTADAVVRFLRTAPGLDKDKIGEYLGSQGIEVSEDDIGGDERDQKVERVGTYAKSGTPVYLGDTASFHVAVLKAFVKSFDFANQPLILALRMFLSAFRLPGEAQQIDRVVQAFADSAFASCAEAKGGHGSLPTSDSVYLLTFSIIMLHTNLHNPNIRNSERMSLEDFIKNNTNYGPDISLSRDLPPELLTDIYKHISEEQFETHKDSPVLGVVVEGSPTVAKKVAEIDLGNHSFFSKYESDSDPSVPASSVQHNKDNGQAATAALMKSLNTVISTARWKDLLRFAERQPTSKIMMLPLDSHTCDVTPVHLNGTTNSKGEWLQNSAEKDLCSEIDNDEQKILNPEMRDKSTLSFDPQKPLSKVNKKCSVDGTTHTYFEESVSFYTEDNKKSCDNPLSVDDRKKSSKTFTSFISNVEMIDHMVLHTIWRPCMEAIAGLFLLGKAAAESSMLLKIGSKSDMLDSTGRSSEEESSMRSDKKEILESMKYPLAFSAHLENSTTSLRQAVDASLLLAKLVATHAMHEIFDSLIYLLCGFTGFLAPWSNNIGELSDALEERRILNVEPSNLHESQEINDIEALTASDNCPISETKSKNSKDNSYCDGEERGQEYDASKAKTTKQYVVEESNGRTVLQKEICSKIDNAVALPLASPSISVQIASLRYFVASPAAQMAAVAAFGLVHRLGNAMRAGWKPILRLVFRLRDLHLLSPELLCETDEDLLSERSNEDSVFSLPSSKPGVSDNVAPSSSAGLSCNLPDPFSTAIYFNRTHRMRLAFDDQIIAAQSVARRHFMWVESQSNQQYMKRREQQEKTGIFGFLFGHKKNVASDECPKSTCIGDDDDDDDDDDDYSDFFEERDTTNQRSSIATENCYRNSDLEEILLRRVWEGGEMWNNGVHTDAALQIALALLREECYRTDTTQDKKTDFVTSEDEICALARRVQVTLASKTGMTVTYMQAAVSLVAARERLLKSGFYDRLKIQTEAFMSSSVVRQPWLAGFDVSGTRQRYHTRRVEFFQDSSDETKSGYYDNDKKTAERLEINYDDGAFGTNSNHCFSTEHLALEIEREELRNLARQQLAPCHVEELVHNTRELQEDSLWAMLHAISVAIHDHLPLSEQPAPDYFVSANIASQEGNVEQQKEKGDITNESMHPSDENDIYTKEGKANKANIPERNASSSGSNLNFTRNASINSFQKMWLSQDIEFSTAFVHGPTCDKFVENAGIFPINFDNFGTDVESQLKEKIETNDNSRLSRQIYLPAISLPCLPFAEVLFVEVVLRNRDRFSHFWPLVSEHYRRRLAAKVIQGNAMIDSVEGEIFASREREPKINRGNDGKAEDDGNAMDKKGDSMMWFNSGVHDDKLSQRKMLRRKSVSKQLTFLPTTSLEKACTGLLRVVYRLANRPDTTQQLVGSLSWLVNPRAATGNAQLLGKENLPSGNREVHTSSIPESCIHMDTGDINASLSEPKVSGLSMYRSSLEEADLLASLAPHFGTALLRLFTSDAGSLLFLPPEGWLPIFDLLKLCAKGGNSVGHREGFKALSLLLREPRLKACVPVTCIGVVYDFLMSPYSPKSIVIASLDLLTILNERIEALVLPSSHLDMEKGMPESSLRERREIFAKPKETITSTVPQVESTFQGEHTRHNEIRSSQVQLLAKCWFPIIDAFGACVKDPRQPAIVRLHALVALRNAVLQNNYSLILERFLPEEMHRILIEVIYPAALVTLSEPYLPYCSTDTSTTKDLHHFGKLKNSRETVEKQSTAGSENYSNADEDKSFKDSSLNIDEKGAEMGNYNRSQVCQSHYMSAIEVESGHSNARVVTKTALAPHLLNGSWLDDQRKAHAIALEILCKTFLRHLPSMLPNGHITIFQSCSPPFHELWLKVLTVLQIPLVQDSATQMFTGKTRPSSPKFRANVSSMKTGNEEEADLAAELSRSQSLSDDASVTEETARSPDLASQHYCIFLMAFNYLKTFLLVMAELGFFTPGEDTIGGELWEFTWTVLDGMPACDGLQQTLFPGANSTAPPAPSFVPPHLITPLTDSMQDADFRFGEGGSEEKNDSSLKNVDHDMNGIEPILRAKQSNLTEKEECSRQPLPKQVVERLRSEEGSLWHYQVAMITTQLTHSLSGILPPEVLGFLDLGISDDKEIQG